MECRDVPVFLVIPRSRAGGEVMAGEPVVVGLLYRADWTRLSLAAVTDGGSRCCWRLGGGTAMSPAVT